MDMDMDMDSASSSTSSSSMSMSSMATTFINAHNTPLYGTRWSPSNTGQYAGTCIFLIVLAVLLRASFALKHRLEVHWRSQALQRRFVYVADKLPAAERVPGEDADGDVKRGIFTVRGVDESVEVVAVDAARLKDGWDGVGMPWRFSVDLPRAVLVTIQAGVGYLLMLAVMTYNVGYYLSILGGVFLGELAFGRFYAHRDLAHDH